MARRPNPSPADADAFEAVANRLVDVDVVDEMEESFLSYSLSVITSRAIPDIRDGLKPVQRRILYAMADLGLRPDRPYSKCSRVVGHTMGTYHPHGDSAIYEALVRLGQSWVMSTPLVDGHGNYGSLDGPAAASRYTEARLGPAATAMLDGIDESTVDTTANFDGRVQEPTVLPAGIPNLLVNGTSGIAVGLATSIPPHNLREVADAVIHLAQNPKATVEDLMVHLPGPDFPTGGVLASDGILDAYRTGRGQVVVRARATIEQLTARRKGIVVTELPYNVGPERVIARIKELVNDGKLRGVSDVADLTDRRNGLRVVIDVRSGHDPESVLDELYATTPLQEIFHLNAVALIDRTPTQVGLVDMCRHYLEHRKVVIRRRSEHRRAKAQARAHIVEGLLRALDVIDDVVAAIRSSKDTASARKKLTTAPFEFSTTQAEHILEMPLRRLTNLEAGRLRAELKDLNATIRDLNRILKSPKKLLEVVVAELDETATAHSTTRRTRIVARFPKRTPPPAPPAAEVADGTAEAGAAGPVRVCVDWDGTVSRLAESRRAARPARSHLDLDGNDEVLVVCESGLGVRVRAGEIGEVKARDRGWPVAELTSDTVGTETAAGIVPAADTFTVVTAGGIVKRVKTSDLTRAGTQSVIRLRDDDKVIAAFPASDDTPLVFVTSDGRVLQFLAGVVRPQGRTGGGVVAIKLSDAASVIAAGPGGDEVDVWVRTDAGGVKRSALGEHPPKGRGTGGVLGLRFRADESALTDAVVTDGAVLTRVAGAWRPVDRDRVRRDTTASRDTDTGPLFAAS